MQKIEALTHIARNITEILKLKKLTATHASKLCHISNGTMSKILQGQMNMSVGLLLSIANGLGVSVDDIVSGAYTPSQSLHKIVLKTSLPLLFVGILTVGDKRLTCVQDQDGITLGTSELEGSLALTDTFPGLLQSIIKSIAIALQQKPDELDLRAIHLAIVTHCYELEETRERYLFNGLKHFKSFQILADWQLTYLAAFSEFPGISLVVDKGVSLSYVLDNKLEKLGGWGFPIYDLGGEYWLGLMAVRHTIEAFEGFDQKTELSQNVLTRFDGKLERLIEYCIKNNKTNEIYCEFCQQLLYSFLSNGRRAKEILMEGYHYIDRAIQKVDQAAGQPLKISLNGSLANIYRPFIDPARLLKKINEESKANILSGVARNGIKI